MSEQVEYKEWAIYDFEVLKGTDKEVQITAYDENDVLVDLTGYHAYMQIRNKPNGTIYLSLTDASGITLGGSLGTIKITITDTQSAAFNFKYGNYTFILQDSTGLRSGLIKGKCTVVESDTIVA